MPPKSTATAKKPAAKSTTAAKAAPKTTAKPGAKSTAKAEPKAAATKEAAAAPPPPKPIVFAEIGIKQLDKFIRDDEGTVKATGKWPTIVDEQGLPGRFLRHRDVNMLSVPDPDNMQPETIRKALIGSIRFGKPFIVDMMESEMFEYCKDQFDKILPGLLEMVLDKSIIDDTYRYMKIVKDEDSDEYKNQFNYNVTGFCCIFLSQTSPSEELLRKTYPVKIV